MSDLFIILTPGEADAVRGPTAPGAALDPVPLTGGAAFALPEAILADPDHARQRAVLAGLPRRALAAGEAEADPPPQ